MYSHISAIAILAIIELNHCSGSDVYLTSNGLQTLFFGEVSHVLNFEKKRMSDRYCPVWYYCDCDWQVGVSSRIHFYYQI